MNRFLFFIYFSFIFFNSCTESPIKEDINKSKICDSLTSVAGEDKLFQLTDSVKLNASTPKDNEQANWFILSGIDCRISDMYDPKAIFWGKRGNHYTLEWITINDCGKTATDTIEISFECNTIFSNAGEDQFENKQYKTKLCANVPSIEQTGKWAIIEGSGGKLDNENHYDATLSTLEEGVFKLVWTITNNCDEISKDTVTIEFVSPFNYDTITDIDGNRYKTIQIGSQIWMAENLKTTRYNDGTPIEYASNLEQWYNTKTGCYCWFNNNISFKEEYGALYNHIGYIVDKVCPINWHLPTEEEWFELIKYVDPSAVYGESSYEGLKLISIKENGTDNFGFSAIKAGEISTLIINEVQRNFVENTIEWWGNGSNPGFGYTCVSIRGAWIYPNHKSAYSGKSIRCVKDKN